ncbi:MAG: hypothetical protein HWN79_19270 [Candidatus Lokiarchaeota archaeon]|nr:hypothetical protein [Candidatus Lokiarchaeota archaeon]
MKAYEQLWINKFKLKNCCVNKQGALGLLTKEKKKDYRENNKDKISQKNKKYFENNKDKMSQKIECPICNSIVQKCGLKKHQRTIKCMEFQKK